MFKYLPYRDNIIRVMTMGNTSQKNLMGFQPPYFLSTFKLQRQDKRNEEEIITLTKAPKQSANVLVLTLMVW